MTKSNRLKQLEELLKEDAGSSFLLFAIAKEYESMDDYKHALEYYHKLTTEHPEYTGTYYHYADLLMEIGETEEGFRIYDIGIDICKKGGDQHALAELQNARMNWELEL